jgi:hypothetical protein
VVPGEKMAAASMVELEDMVGMMDGGE